MDRQPRTGRDEDGKNNASKNLPRFHPESVCGDIHQNKPIFTQNPTGEMSQYQSVYVSLFRFRPSTL